MFSNVVHQHGEHGVFCIIGCGDTQGAYMLVLSRQRDETIMIGDDIEVTVVDIRGDKVRLGINAPKEISVHRKEVYDAIRRENRAAVQQETEQVVEVEVSITDLRLSIHKAVDSDRVEDIDQGMQLFKQLRQALAKAA